VAVDCGWGRLLFGQTFTDPESLARALQEEHPGKRDVALYLNDPHVVLSYAPQDLFLDPSHTFRLWFERYQSCARRPKGFHIRLLNSHADAEAIQRLYLAHHMVPPGAEFVWNQRTSKVLSYWVAEDSQDGSLLGVVNGVDHAAAFQDPENGASLWALAVDPQAPYPGIGEALVRQVVEYHQARGRAFLDLSVMHDNSRPSGSIASSASSASRPSRSRTRTPSTSRCSSAAARGRSQSLCHHHRRRGAPARDRGRGDRRRGGLFPLTSAGAHPLPREPERADQRDRHEPLRRQGGHPRVLKRAGLRVPDQIEAIDARSGRGLPVAFRPGRGQAGARRAGARGQRSTCATRDDAGDGDRDRAQGLRPW
jgi:ribosomal protein S18 acetylase RimI-like enzyme